MKTKLLPLLSLLLLTVFYSCSDKKKVEKQPVDGVFSHPSVAAVSKQIEAEPGNAALFYKRAMALSDLEADSLALRDLNKAVTLDSGKAVYFSAIGELMFRHKDIAGSVKWFRKAIALDPKDPVAHLQFARMLVYSNDNQKAFNEINTVLRNDPYNAEAYYLKGLTYRNLNDTAKALSSFRTSVQVDPRYYESVLQLGLIYTSIKDPIGLKYLDNAFALDSTDMLPVYAKGMYYQELNQYERAKEVYHSCILGNPQYGDAYFNTGWILMQQDSLDKAIRQFDFVTKIEPANPEAYYNRGLCHELLKHTAAAVSDYKQALDFDPEYPEPKEGLKRLGATSGK